MHVHRNESELVSGPKATILSKKGTVGGQKPGGSANEPTVEALPPQCQPKDYGISLEAKLVG